MVAEKFLFVIVYPDTPLRSMAGYNTARPNGLRWGKHDKKRETNNKRLSPDIVSVCSLLEKISGGHCPVTVMAFDVGRAGCADTFESLGHADAIACSDLQM